MADRDLLLTLGHAMLTLLRRYATPLCVLALMLAPLLLFWPVTLGGLTLLPVDNVFQYEPFRASAAALGVGAPQNHLLSDLAEFGAVSAQPDLLSSAA